VRVQVGPPLRAARGAHTRVSSLPASAATCSWPQARQAKILAGLPEQQHQILLEITLNKTITIIIIIILIVTIMITIIITIGVIIIR